MIIESVPPYRPSHFRVKFATSAWERRACARLRRQVFCTEQGLFAEDDRDAIDAHAIPICALSTLGGDTDALVGTVRIHELAERPTEWWGSRLAVARPFRGTAALGAGLIQVAVSSAHARGCTRFLAHVQERNVPLFQALHWASLDTVELHGLPHHLMQADLAAYPPMHDPEHGLVTFRRAA
ncbi:MSMEG_0567/Sll0786 family nitrogen starvation N-acetyltransferase [Methylorubrum zatmanii]|uniref:MSMEG_0567/Sll0786 family nitrogen starvation N-acetyltransferase n=1 Tax=Methylorubrum zatmanii TaxID=29429 RepID=A0ABW1WTM5_9HYPH|nr:MSMEG_0567/Sll0786 family nitrogen starvation N-acetyltransferase [Methylorubrum zatmanii]MBD8905962.1 histone acetyltransferase [Methylorubrum zatmanii]